MAEEKEFKNWIALARFTARETAEMVVEALRSKDIPAVLKSSAGHFGITGQLGPASFRPISGAFYTLMVPQEYAYDADQEGCAILGEDWDGIKLVDIEEER